MRVLFVYIIPGGGVDTLNRQRCHALSQQGIECHCLYFQPGSGLQNTAAEGVPTFVTGNSAEIIAIINLYQYQALVVTCAFMEVRMLRQLGYGGRIIYEIQGLGTMTEARKKMTDSVPYIDAFADAILVPATPHVLALCAETFPGKLTYSFNNPLDTQHFTYRSGQPKTEAPIAAWFGRLEYNKNWRDFLFIGYHLAQRYPKMKLWMFHDHTLAQADDAALFELTVADLKLQNNLVIRSNVPHAEMPGIFSAIGDSGGFLCAPSRVEGAPYAVIEAMSCRCPVLTTDSDGVRSAVVHNVTGKYFDHGDIDGAVREAFELMEDSELRERIRAAGRKHIDDHFSNELYCRNFLEMLRGVGAV